MEVADEIKKGEEEGSEDKNIETGHIEERLEMAQHKIKVIGPVTVEKVLTSQKTSNDTQEVSEEDFTETERDEYLTRCMDIGMAPVKISYLVDPVHTVRKPISWKRQRENETGVEGETNQKSAKIDSVGNEKGMDIEMEEGMVEEEEPEWERPQERKKKKKKKKYSALI
eukprot:Trichotokara_eunicae@DN4683_c0_g1_i1.p1